MTKRRIGRLVIQYYLSVRMSAAAAMPDLGYPEIQFPPPIVRQQPAHLHDGWDERELIRDGDTEGSSPGGGYSHNDCLELG
ncbi:MAG: hypothetical protein R2849_02500 [Thermomicrobiales bacterium]